MQTHNSFLDELKSLYNRSTFMKLIFLNAIVFLAIQLFLLFMRMAGNEFLGGTIIARIFSMPVDWDQFIRQPWSVITSIFSHFGFLHLLLNMLMLYYVGRIFEQIYSGRKLLYTYLLGGLAGSIFELLSHLLFPNLFEIPYTIVGASGAIMALFVLLAFSQPHLRVSLIFLPPIRIVWIAAIYILFDFLRIGTNDGVAHFAHLGGAALGMWGAQNVHSASNIITMTANGVDSFLNLFRRKKRPKLKVKRGANVRHMTDEEYNADAKARQDEIDRILDKISKSGYESLSKKEKDFLFNQSKNG